MSKAKKTGIVMFLLVLAAAILWLYWERPLSLGERIPQEAWVRMELNRDDGTNTGDYVVFQEPPIDEILNQIQATRVNRAQKDRLLEGNYFQLLLYKGEAYPTMLYVEENGQIHIAAELDFDHWKNYEGGEELYRYLSNLSQRLPAIYPMT